jgi:hypothetical protein
MENEEKIQINEKSIISSGKKLEMIGKLIFVNIGVSFLFLFINSNSKLETQLFLMVLLGIISFIILITIAVKFIQSGEELQKSVINPIEINPIEKLRDKMEYYPNGNLRSKIEYHYNGNLKSIERFNEKGEREGIWEYYFESGELDLKVEYKNDNLIRQGFD